MAYIRRIGVVGAGTMGSGIAQLAAQTGHRVILADVSGEILEAARERMRSFWDRAVEKGRMTAGEQEACDQRLDTTLSLSDFHDTDLVIEAAIEDLEVKRRIFAELDCHCPAAARLATNTSSLSIGALAAGTRDAGRVAGMHFFNPAPLMALVELIRGEATSDETMQVLEEVARSLGKTPVVAQDTPGFIVNRAARPYYLEPLRIVGEGLANPATVDAVMENAGFPMGPFTLMDLVGIDVNHAVSLSVHRATGQERFRPHEIQRRMIASGRLGRKSGQGFYAYPGGKREYTETSGLPRMTQISPEESGPRAAAEDVRRFSGQADQELRILPRMLGSLINEAARLLGEGVAGKQDIDTAMRLGLNWPWGPLAWGEQIGLEQVVSVLDILHLSTRQQHYRPAPWLLSLVRRGKREFENP